ncbi:MAG TPA: HD domain-containing phosphohydrolase [Candidatus Elarobacter sp.]|nr:HD domain-containing phosphohydrolase [Candidatus Elarobacter sp.]
MPARIALSEVISALSCALDLTDGQPLGHSMRACLIGMRLGRQVGLGVEEASALYYTLLLKDAGCSSNAARLCQLFGTDDLALKPSMRSVDRQKPVMLAFQTARTVALGQGAATKIRHLLGIAKSDGVMDEIMTLRCERGADIALRLGFPQITADAIRHLDEHWNGRGHPDGLAGDAIPLASRIANLAQVVEAHHHAGGPRAAVKVARRRSGTWFDPALADRVVRWRHEESWWDGLGTSNLPADVVAQEPSSNVRWVSDDDLDTVARAFADIIDAKSPFTYSHSRNVAAYALGIARELGVDATGQRRVYRAGLLHDIGKLGVSNSILDKAGPLDAAERAAVERHPFYTWEILSCVPAFRDFAWAAALHHERLDGSGYPWRLSGNRLDITARILAVADVYEALTADRPYRAGLRWEESFRILSAGRGTAFDPAVLDALVRCHAAYPDMAQLTPLVAA